MVIALPSEPALTLNPGRDTGCLDHVRRDVGADSIVGPLSSTLNQQTSALILPQPVRPKSLGFVLIHTIHPRSPPHRTTDCRTGQHHIRRAVPGQVIQVDATIRPLFAADLDTDLRNRRAADITDAPLNLVVSTWLQDSLWSIRPDQFIVGTIGTNIEMASYPCFVYTQTDPGGNTTYYVWFELARMEFLRELSYGFTEMERDGMSYLVTTTPLPVSMT